MTNSANSATDPVPRAVTYELEADDEGFKTLTREEAQKLRETSPSISPWSVLAGQLVVGVLVACATWALTGQRSAGWSALYGALAVVIPAALFARGLTGKVWSMNPGTAVAGFFLWEMVKIALTVAMLFAAPRLVSMLSWPAMLVGLVVTMKTSWLALLFAVRKNKL
ncbi:F0F1-type ATP synthase, subunit I [Polaromonas sp. CF318]|uniref:ATP synthase subunit I n=1 Tax=Polaromonas sp. CF318 TaxID=1144318 RepID=UPI000270F23E|nr:ATP synthase subunit I [Polaromonas sp. CF318]EJL83710.1 F0F1-type ATP synthase, subunit I [Polaromonas sp. CF318]